MLISALAMHGCNNNNFNGIFHVHNSTLLISITGNECNLGCHIPVSSTWLLLLLCCICFLCNSFLRKFDAVCRTLTNPSELELLNSFKQVNSKFQQILVTIRQARHHCKHLARIQHLQPNHEFHLQHCTVWVHIQLILTRVLYVVHVWLIAILTTAMGWWIKMWRIKMTHSQSSEIKVLWW